MINQYCAFFDVDGTLINTRSMFNFLDFFAERQGNGDHEFRDYYHKLHTLLRSGASRTDINRFYYSFLKGIPVDHIAALGQEWFAVAGGLTGFYNGSMLALMDDHKKNGAHLVLVTGAFMQIVEPLIRELGVDAALCTVPKVSGGIFTGEVHGQPCIGEGKVAAIRDFARDNNIDLERCVAYGDDESDLPMIAAVGSGELIQPDPRYKDELNTLLTWVGRDQRCG